LTDLRSCPGRFSLTGVGGADNDEAGELGSGGRSAAEVGVIGAMDSPSMLRYLRRSYNDGRALNRGRKPTFIHAFQLA
jgi:hypothetical protein